MYMNSYWTKFTGICMYSNRSRGVCRYMFLMSIVMNFANSVEMKILRRILVVNKSAVLVVSSSEKTIRFSPIVSLTLFGSDFCG